MISNLVSSYFGIVSLSTARLLKLLICFMVRFKLLSLKYPELKPSQQRVLDGTIHNNVTSI